MPRLRPQPAGITRAKAGRRYTRRMSQRTPSPGDESRMGRTYTLVLLWQVVVTIALWWFGRAFTH